MGNALSGNVISHASLAGNAVAITGCDTGFGYETTLVLLSHGLDVFAGCLTEEGGVLSFGLELRGKVAGNGGLFGTDGRKNLKRVVDENKALYRGKLTALQLDVTNDASVAAFAQAIDGLINNAGIAETGPIELTPLDAHKRIFDVNYFGSLRVMLALLPSLRRFALHKPARSPAPRVVNIASIAGRSICPTLAAYSATKHALKALTEAARVELGPFGVKVVVVEPSFAATPIVTNYETQVKRISGNFERCGEDAREAYGVKEGLVEEMMVKGKDVGTSALTMKPKQVVDCIVQAIEMPRPEIRYVVGVLGYLIILLQNVAPAFLVDFILRQQVVMPATLKKIQKMKQEAALKKYK
ncbi:hypothetical protein HDU96_005589 [Phlyctochytrium bullatum]|nr:hypothetical protein HDU96_005589 [Phlyctochytrium bullatum]